MEEKENNYKHKNIMIIATIFIILGTLLFAGVILNEIFKANMSYKGEFYKFESNDAIFSVYPPENYIIINTYNDLKKNYHFTLRFNDKIYFKDQVIKNDDGEKILEKYNEKFFKENSIVIINYLAQYCPVLETRIKLIDLKDSKLNVELYEISRGYTVDNRLDTYIIPINSKDIKSVEITLSGETAEKVLKNMTFRVCLIIIVLLILMWIVNITQINYDVLDKENVRKLKKRNNIKFIIWIVNVICIYRILITLMLLIRKIC